MAKATLVVLNHIVDQLKDHFRRARITTSFMARFAELIECREFVYASLDAIRLVQLETCARNEQIFFHRWIAVDDGRQFFLRIEWDRSKGEIFRVREKRKEVSIDRGKAEKVIERFGFQFFLEKWYASILLGSIRVTYPQGGYLQINCNKSLFSEREQRERERKREIIKRTFD